MAAMVLRTLILLTILPVLTACDQLGIETPAQTAARQEAEGKAIGGGCRYSARPLEECYRLNKRASKASIYTGWREMDAYMRENNIAPVREEGGEGASAESPAPATGDASTGKPDEPSGGKDGEPAGKSGKTGNADKAGKTEEENETGRSGPPGVRNKGGLKQSSLRPLPLV
ncbi:MAG: hypothetical protein JSR19_06180 [Proteobacteria bacterium]|nr:hypothetical protein [Pseudomonadota bacterium]HQR04758.1 hypothetical protein [Rhodocyclaceae bacterium]